MGKQYILGRISQNRQRVTKYILCQTALFAAVILLQTSVFGHWKILGGVPNLTFASLLLVSYFCGKETGAITGICCGFALDALGTLGISILPLCYLICGYVCGYYTRAIVPKRFTAFLTVLGAAIPAGALITVILVCLQYGQVHLPYIFMRIVLPEAVTTALAAMALFYPVRWVCNYMNR